MIKAYNRMSFMLGIPGIIIQVLGLFMVFTGNNRGWLMAVMGSGLFVAGLAYYAKAKARSPWWCLLGLFSLLGMIILAVMPDESYDGQTR
jgi:hypothetical protein